MEELCFLYGPCRDVTSREQGYRLVTSVRKTVKKGLEPEAQE
jgi:hypothetical protein